MGALKAAFLAAVVLLWAAPAVADPLAPWDSHIAEASMRFGVPKAWIRQVMRAESGGHARVAGRPIVSRAGAMGLMQLMPATWEEMRRRFHLGRDPHDPRDNILAGTAYLRLMYDRFGYPGLFAAYNAGPTRYARHLSDDRPLPRETVAYLAAVAGPGIVASAAPDVPAPASSLFAIRYDGPRSAGASNGLSASGAPAGLFALPPARPR